MSRDQVNIPQQSLLWVAFIGVGLLTFAFVMGVQVGKQGAALRGPRMKTVDEELRDLPEPLNDQLRILESADAEQRPVEPPKPDAQAEAKVEHVERWTLQLIGAKDAAEAKKVVDRAKAAGFKAIIVKEQGLHKVRLERADSRSAMDKQAEKLKQAGFKPFAVKVE